MAKKSAVKNPEKASDGAKNWVVATSSDGTVQITYTLPYSLIKKEEDKVIAEYKSKVAVPGFRKGMAPDSKVREQIPENARIEHTLEHILPGLLARTIQEDKLKLAIYPKFQLIKANPGEDWQVLATSCTIPEVDLGEYKKELSGAAQASALWTPDKGKPTEKPKEPTREEKEQLAISTLLQTVKVVIPKILIDEEVNMRLSKLLERIEKLGLSLEQYIASLGKSIDDLRKDYEDQARNALTLDLALSQIAIKDNISVEEKEIDAAITATTADPKLAEHLSTPEQKDSIRAVLTKRKALDTLISYL